MVVLRRAVLSCLAFHNETIPQTGCPFAFPVIVTIRDDRLVEFDDGAVLAKGLDHNEPAPARCHPFNNDGLLPTRVMLQGFCDVHGQVRLEHKPRLQHDEDRDPAFLNYFSLEGCLASPLLPDVLEAKLNYLCQAFIREDEPAWL